jgi:hypothetical protein
MSVSGQAGSPRPTPGREIQLRDALAAAAIMVGTLLDALPDDRREWLKESVAKQALIFPGADKLQRASEAILREVDEPMSVIRALETPSEIRKGGYQGSGDPGEPDAMTGQQVQPVCPARGDGGLGEAVLAEVASWLARYSGTTTVDLYAARAVLEASGLPARLAAAEQRAEAWTRETERANRDRQAAERQVEALREDNERLNEAVSQHPEKWSFDTMLFIARRVLDVWYPTNVKVVCDKDSPDPGPRLAAALHDCLAALTQQGETP